MTTARQRIVRVAMLLIVGWGGSSITVLGAQDPFSLPIGKVGQEYPPYQFKTEGGLTPLTWRIVEGELPVGITLDPSGKLRGAPTTPRREAYRFVLEVADSSQPPQRFVQPFLLVVQAAPLRIVLNQPSLKIITPPKDIASAPGTREGSGVSCEADHIKICGKLRPASLDQTLALINSVPELRNGELMKRIDFGRFKPGGTCDERNSSEYMPGAQKEAVIRLLEYVLAAFSADESHLESSSKNILDLIGGQPVAAEDQPAPPPPIKTSAEETSLKQAVAKIRKARMEQFRRLSEETIKRQIEFLNSYLGNVQVEIKYKDDKDTRTRTALTDRDGNYVACVPKQSGEYQVSTEGDNHSTQRKVSIGGNTRVDIPIEDRPVSLLTRAVVGYQQAAPASLDFEQNYFFDIFIRNSFPVPQQIDPDFGEKFQVWGAIRAASVPQAGTFTISEAVSGFSGKVANLKVNEAARVFDFLGGAEFRLKGNNSLLPSFARDTKQKFSLSLIGSYGFVTPNTPEQSIRKFEISDQLRELFPKETQGKTLVAFTNNDRDRFFNQVYAGIRLQTFFFNRYNVPLQRFPAQFDVQFGLNSYVTGGRLNQGVFRLDGYFPLPYNELKFINLYATALIRPAHARTDKPLILKRPGKDFDVPGPDIAIIPLPQFNRDYYKVGVGIDFISFVQALLKKP